MYLAAAISNENIAFLAVIVFPVLLFGGFLLQWLVKTLRGSTQMALYELSRGPIESFEEIPEEDRLPGYDTLTKEDYDEIYNVLKEELLREMAAKNGGAPASAADKTTSDKK
ncbi:MAG: hypothetical protein IJT91_05890 [Clostridia bacterium]|nr:hypothetical protein [Clostridia bacterium]